jgi:hypothetical protein
MHATCPIHLIRLDSNILIMFCEERYAVTTLCYKHRIWICMVRTSW